MPKPSVGVTNPHALKRFVLEDMERYHAEYDLPPPGATVGMPWSKERVAAELDRMRPCLVEPVLVECSVRDTFDDVSAQHPERRECWLVAVDGGYGLLFDPIANDFALAGQSEAEGWATFGVRGDAVTTFLAR